MDSRKLPDVGAGRKRGLVCTAQYDELDTRIVVNRIEAPLELLPHGVRDGVALFWPVEHEPSDFPVYAHFEARTVSHDY